MNKRLFCAAISLILLLLVAGKALAVIDVEEYRTFQSWTRVIPVDNKQNDRLKVWEFIFALEARGITVFRILSPPDPVLVTSGANSCPGGCTYYGGTFFVEGSIPYDIATAFPTVTVQTLQAPVSSGRVIRYNVKPEILIVRPDPVPPPDPDQNWFGRTDLALQEMGITDFDVRTLSEVLADPSIIAPYDVVVHDCWGWYGFIYQYPWVMDAYLAFARAGGELIFTDIAQADLAQIFYYDPDPPPAPPVYDQYMYFGNDWYSYVYGYYVNQAFTVHPNSTSLGQYYGPPKPFLYLYGDGVFGQYTIHPDTWVLLETSVYSGSMYESAIPGPPWPNPSDPGWKTPYPGGWFYGPNIAAFYFPYYKGIVQGFGFHLYEQPDEYKPDAAQFFGAKFLHTRPCGRCRMNGLSKLIGKFGGSKYSQMMDYDFNLHCWPDVLPNSLNIKYGAPGMGTSGFKLTSLTKSECFDDPAIGPGKPLAGFDTVTGEGIGKFNGMPGYRVVFTFTDTFNPRDRATFTIYDPSNNVVLAVDTFISAGGHTARQQ